MHYAKKQHWILIASFENFRAGKKSFERYNTTYGSATTTSADVAIAFFFLLFNIMMNIHTFLCQQHHDYAKFLLA